MRVTFCLSVFLALSVCPGTQPSLRGDDKKDEERRWKETEKKLVKADAMFEKEGWAVRNRKAISDLTKELQKAQRVQVFRLDPKPLKGKTAGAKGEFHGYDILSESSAGTADARKEVTAFIAKTLHWNELRKALCFNPRHGVRVVVGKRTLDFLVCFECYAVEVYEKNEILSSFALTYTKENPIERLLKASEKKAK
jgi:hypothetical protein